MPSAPVAEVEALVEPFHDVDFSGRTGYDEEFLGIRIPPPTVVDETLVSSLDDGSHVLPYEHFSIVVNKNRRLALFTASNVDAAPARKRPEPGHDYSRKGLSGLGENDREKWFADPRIPAVHQLPDRFYSKDRASFDKGDIVRREDVAWGDSFDEIRRANGDTYHVTNCSPQVAAFNQAAKKGVWGQLENLILDQAKTEQYSPRLRRRRSALPRRRRRGSRSRPDPATVLEDRRRAEGRRRRDVRVRTGAGPLPHRPGIRGGRGVARADDLRA